MKIVFVHGRSQEGKDPDELLKSWIEALENGGEKISTNPLKGIASEDICFPYYGDSLVALLEPGEDDTMRSTNFIEEVNNELKTKYKIPYSDSPDNTSNEDDVLRSDEDNMPRGVLNWKIVRSVLGGIDNASPEVTARIISSVLRDVGHYLEVPSARKIVDDIVKDSIQDAYSDDAPILVVAHSLGTVTAYSVLHELSADDKWHKKVRLITVGSPLAIKAVKARISGKCGLPLAIPKSLASWHNGADITDVVALIPRIDRLTFFEGDSPPFDVVNITDIENDTPNHHGISGYLGDSSIARIFKELTQI